MGSKGMFYDWILGSWHCLGSDQERSSSSIFDNWSDRGFDLSDNMARRNNNIACFGSHNWRNLFTDISIYRTGNRIWRQLDHSDYGNLFRDMETFSCSVGCISWGGCSCRNWSDGKAMQEKKQDSFFAIFNAWISKHLWVVKKTCKASTIVEMAYLMPVVLLTWMLIIFALFYYHDKNIIAGAAYETAVVGSEYYQSNEEIESEELEQYFQSRIKRKLLFFPWASVKIEVEEEQIVVTGSASSKGMRVEIKESAEIIYPEKRVRKVKMIKDGLEDISK